MYRLIVSIILATTFLYLSQEQEKQSKIFWDGNDWNTYKGEEGYSIKLGYLIGLYHGQIASANNIYDALEQDFFWKRDEIAQLITKITKYSDLSLGGAKWAKVIESVDNYYKDSANNKIPVFSLATLVSRKLMGELGPEEAALVLLQMRAFYIKPISYRVIR
jgi:hypothetical protein